MIVMGFVQA